MLCCVVPPRDTGMAEAPHEKQGCEHDTAIVCPELHLMGVPGSDPLKATPKWLPGLHPAMASSGSVLGSATSGLGQT